MSTTANEYTNLFAHLPGSQANPDDGSGSIPSHEGYPQAAGSGGVPPGGNAGGGGGGYRDPPGPGAGTGGVYGTQSVVQDDGGGGYKVRSRVGLFSAQKFGYNKPIAINRASMAGAIVDTEDVMSLADARAILSRLHVEFGIDRAPVEVRSSFDNCLLMYIGVNQTSVLNPGDGKFGAAGMVYEYKRVVPHLGPKPRQFYRVFADEIRAILKYYLDNYDPHNLDEVNYVNAIRRNADDRGVPRMPEYSSDTALYCSDLNPSQTAILKASALRVIGGTANAVDVVNVARPVARDVDGSNSNTM